MGAIDYYNITGPYTLREFLRDELAFLNINFDTSAQLDNHLCKLLKLDIDTICNILNNSSPADSFMCDTLNRFYGIKPRHIRSFYNKEIKVRKNNKKTCSSYIFCDDIATKNFTSRKKKFCDMYNDIYISRISIDKFCDKYKIKNTAYDQDKSLYKHYKSITLKFKTMLDKYPGFSGTLTEIKELINNGETAHSIRIYTGKSHEIIKKIYSNSIIEKQDI